MRTTILGGAALLVLSGCSSNSYSYRPWVRDPGAVELRASDKTVLAPGSPPGRQTLATGVVRTRSTSADYTLGAERSDRGGVSLWVDTHAAQPRGDRVPLVRDDGEVVRPNFAGPDFQAQGPDIRVPFCASLVPGRSGYWLDAGRLCAAPALLEGEIVLPRSSVLQIVEERRGSSSPGIC